MPRPRTQVRPGVPLRTGPFDGAGRLVDYWATVYRRTWKGSVISSFVMPLLYILAMGVLLGGFIEGDPDQLEGATSYLAFVAPGMLAAQSMTTVFGEVTYPVMGMIKWQKHLLRDDRHAARPSATSSSPTSASCCSGSAPCAACSSLVMAPFGVFASVVGRGRGVPRAAADRARVRDAALRAHRGDEERERASR